MRNREIIFRILAAGMIFIVLHEMGHYIVAANEGMDPKMVYGNPNAGITGFSIGVQYVVGSAGQDLYVIAGALLLPLAISVPLLLFRKTRIYGLVLLVLSLIMFVPVPGLPEADANQFWALLLG